MPCTIELKSVPKVNGLRRLKLLKDVVGHDNCLNQPRSLELKAGTVLSISSEEGAYRGDIFFSAAGHPPSSVALPRSALASRYPHDLGAYDPDFLEPLPD